MVFTVASSNSSARPGTTEWIAIQPQLLVAEVCAYGSVPGFCLERAHPVLSVPQHVLLWLRHAKAGSRLDEKVLRGFGLRFRSSVPASCSLTARFCYLNNFINAAGISRRNRRT